MILDCTEIHVQRASSVRLNTELYSHYKSTTTLKALVGITPPGAVRFDSAMDPGSVSVNVITQNSYILGLLEKIDQVTVDKRLTISVELLKVGATLVVPSFLTQFTQQRRHITEQNRTEQKLYSTKTYMNYIGFSCHKSSDKENTYKNINYKHTKTTK